MNRAVEEKINKLLNESDFLETIRQAWEEYKNGPTPDLYNYGEPQPPVEAHAPVGADSNETNTTGLEPGRIKKLFGDIKIPDLSDKNVTKK
jgi:hypothetical protein